MATHRGQFAKVNLTAVSNANFCRAKVAVSAMLSDERLLIVMSLRLLDLQSSMGRQ